MARDETIADVGTDATESTGLLRDRDNTGHSERRSDDGEVWAGYADFEGLPWWKTPSIWFLLVPYALFTLAFGGMVVPKLNIILELVCRRYFADRSARDPDYTFTPVVPGADNDQCFIPEIQRSVATFMMVLNVLTGLLSALTAPKLGSLSDRYGRKLMLTVCALGGIMNEIITILAAKFPETIHYNWLILGALFDGLTGSFTAGSVLLHSYTSDCTPPSKRGVSIGYLHSCLFMGLAFGPLLAGYFAEWTGSLLSIFYVTLGCHIFWVFSMLFITPESLSKKRQLVAREKYEAEKEARRRQPIVRTVGEYGMKVALMQNINGIYYLMKNQNPFAPLKILFPKGAHNARLRRNFLILAFLDMVLLGAAMSAGTVIILYTEYMFRWRNLESSRFVSLVSMVRVVVLLGIFPVINYIFRTRKAARLGRESSRPVVEKNNGADEFDVWILRSAILSDVVGVVGYAVVRDPALFVGCAVITAFGGLGSATIQAALSKHVPAERVGQLLGGIGLLHSLARISAPVLFNGIYAATVSSYPQAFFVVLASLFAAAFIASLMLKPGVYMTEDDAGPVGVVPTPGEREALEEDELLPRVS
ncbi:major facilitator superfamily domain-containing protein [Triangularia verruculosa]|uniref:Major facilitator superfamily domain-containing protein n=1 Tax=Triangularia verruculosa TaxID=2587418 RepID=A0AAN6X6X0_9PEZI|nr:major facilitator superfamily domain-containing protein [Triangularia verruculosa]